MTTAHQILTGDCRETLKTLPDQSVHCVVTSPPYFALRDYGVDGQIGLESTIDEYIAEMVAVFREVRRVLRDDGTCWINMGDSYNANQGAGFNSHSKTRPHLSGDGVGQKRIDKKNRNTKIAVGLPAKNLLGIPWRVALALQSDGWYLRQDIIWAKPNPMPESCRDRCTKSHEYIFLLTKAPRYFYDHEAIKEPAAYAGQPRGGSKKRYEQNNAGMDCQEYSTRNKRTVWTVNPAGFKDAHFATYPPALIEPCILAGTSEKGCCPECGAPWERVVDKTRTFESGSGKSGQPINGKQSAVHGGGETKDLRRAPCVQTKTTGWQSTCDHETLSPIPCTVLDPFGGSATTAGVALAHGRNAITCELNPEYTDMMAARIKSIGKKIRIKLADQDGMLF